MSLPEYLTNGPDQAALTLALAHGAGAPMDSPFMVAIAEGVAAAGFRVIRFEFPYMAEQRNTGAKKPPNPERVLLDTWLAVISDIGAERLVIGGKSMGGRMASMVADASGVRGLACLGYPFHPPSRPEKLRTAHLANLQTPTLICQGERDPFGTPGEVAGYRLAKSIRLHWLKDGDHSLKPRKSSGRTEAQNLGEAAAAIVTFMRGLAA